jgi:integrase
MLSGAAGVCGVQRAIEAWRSGVVSEQGARFVRGVVAAAAPGTPARAKALLFAASRLAAFAERVGLELDRGLLSEAVIERLVLAGCDGLSPASVRTVRTNLRALARALERYPEPPPLPLARERAKRPYPPAEIEGYLRLARAQRTERRRMRASALICLGAGAGVIAGELRHVRGGDIVQRAGGVIVLVSGRRARSVPALADYHEPLLEAAAFAGENFIVGGQEPGRRNITDEFCRALSADRSLPRLEAGRLRSTWLLACAERLGLAGFMQAAGISCSQRLGDLAARLPACSERELVALLGGTA